MTSQLSGRVVFANSVPAEGVRVRIFDKDSPGKGDDDLTLQEGLTGARGEFTVLYDEDRFRDFAELPHFGLGGGSSRFRFPDPFDILTPYLRFEYSLDGTPRAHTAELTLFTDLFRLPESVPIAFLPSQHGFQFPNLFKGYMLPFTIPGFPPAKVPSVYGLCGGMSSAACDYIISGKAVPRVDQAPRTGSKFHRYLFRRAIDTFAMGESILRFARWMALPQEGPRGTYRLTAIEFEQICEELDNHYLVVLGLLYDKGQGLQEIARNVWNNHQVLAYGYSQNADGSYTIRIYDPNYPKDDSITIHAQPVTVSEPGEPPRTGLRCVQKRGNTVLRPVYGFFQMPYEPADPPNI